VANESKNSILFVAPLSDAVAPGQCELAAGKDEKRGVLGVASLTGLVQ
jgi:hypothetical protein